MKKYKSKFEQLLENAQSGNIFDDNDFDLETDNSIEGLDAGTSDAGEIDSEDVVNQLLTIKSTVEALLTSLGFEDGEEDAGDDLELDVDPTGDEIEDLEKESVEMENLPNSKGESLQKMGHQKVVDQTGDLDGAEKKEGQEKHFKFVKIKKPETKEYKQTK